MTLKNKIRVFFLFLSLSSALASLPQTTVEAQEAESGNITFHSTDYNLSYLGNGLFKLEWKRWWNQSLPYPQMVYNKSVDIEVFVSHKEPDELTDIKSLIGEGLSVEPILEKKPKETHFGVTISGERLKMFKYAGFVLFNPVNTSISEITVEEFKAIFEGNNLFVDFFDIFSMFKVKFKSYAEYIVVLVEVESRDVMKLDPVVSDFTTLATCDTDDLSNWSETEQAEPPTSDTATYKKGDASINMGKNGTGAVGFGYNKTLSPTVDMDDLVLVVWVYVDNQTTLDSIAVARVYLYSDIYRPPPPFWWETYGYWNMELVELGWNIWSLRIANADGWGNDAPDFTANNKIKIYFETNNAGDTINLGSLKMDYWHYGTKFTVSDYTEGSPADFDTLASYDVTNALGVFFGNS